MKTNTTRLILLALGMILCGGCRSLTYTYYDGPRQPRRELATIKAGVVSHIGGKNISYLTGHRIVVLPGCHTVGLSGRTRTATGKRIDFRCSFQIAVEAGHVYEGFLDRKLSGGPETVVAGVTDRTTDQVVARYQPQGDDSSFEMARIPAASPMRLSCDPGSRQSLVRLAATY